MLWPQSRSGAVCVSNAQLSMLLEGLNWRSPRNTWHPQPQTPRPLPANSTRRQGPTIISS